jgi:protein arginine kinase activator
MHRSLCESCGSVPACFVVRRSAADGWVLDRFLCAGCARDAERVMFGGGLLLTELLSAANDEASVSGDAGGEDSVCPVCGNSLLDVKKSGMMGCVSCYEFFRTEIEPIVKEIHGCAF